MDVYFVRHGETDGNVAKRHQHQDTELNEVGLVQAQKIASEIYKLKPTHFITSTQLRAVQTTKIIVSKCVDLVPETHNAFEELKRPDWLVGNKYFGLTTVWYVWRWFYGFKIKGEGESYDDLLKRVIEARKYLESLPDDARVVVVSHAVFINIFLEHLHNDQRMNLWRALKRLLAILIMKNVEMIHLEYSDSKYVKKWRLVDVIN
jgi:broad specificity phosphatase PhoE